MSSGATLMQTGASLEKAAAVCIVVHGRGQSPAMMQEHIVARMKVRDICFLLPAAPSGSWYDARAIEALSDKTRQQMQQSLEIVGEVMAQAKSSGKPVMLIGFSQGACLSMEYAFANGGWNGALACLTGCRVGDVRDGRPLELLNGMSVYLTGSDADPWIPIAGFAVAAGNFGAAGARLHCDVFPGRQHEVSDAEIKVLDEMLAAQVMRQ
jgi:phospholipase/carboxylesterase